MNNLQYLKDEAARYRMLAAYNRKNASEYDVRAGEFDAAAEELEAYQNGKIINVKAIGAVNDAA